SEVDGEALQAVRRVLLDEQQQVRQRLLGDEEAIAPLAEAIEAARQRLSEYSVGRHGWSVLGAGLKRVYRAGRKAFFEAKEQPTAERLHEWRKQTKYLWYQLQFLRPIAPAVLEELIDLADEIGGTLGDDHDLVVLRQKLQEQPERF